MQAHRASGTRGSNMILRFALGVAGSLAIASLAAAQSSDGDTATKE